MLNLVNYSSSENSDDEQETPCYKNSKRMPDSDTPKQKLPLPEDIVGLFSNKTNAQSDTPSQLDGRQRSFPHVEGNWATLVYAQYEPEERFFTLQKELFKCLRPLEFQQMDDYHISLSRTVTIRHHWIKDMTDILQEKLANLSDCACEIDSVSVLTNDEKTRSFLVLNVSSADNYLESYVSVIDECFRQYNLQKYYEPPVFHISIGWCLDDITDLVSDKTKQQLKTALNTALQEDREMSYFYFNKLHMKTGNKQFSFPLGRETANDHVT